MVVTYFVPAGVRPVGIFTKKQKKQQNFLYVFSKVNMYLFFFM